MSRRPLFVLACALALTGVGCHRHRHHAPATSVRWVLDPGKLGVPNAEIPVEGGALALGDGGERWLLGTSGALGALAQDLGEPLVAARARDGRFELAGARGALYTARTPLGALERWGSAPAGTRSVALGQEAVVAVDANGALHRSIDGAKSFTKLDVHGMFTQVVMTGTTGLALGVPSFAFATKDDGATWTPITLPPFARRAYVAGDLRVESAESRQYRFHADKNSFEDLGDRSPTAARDEVVRTAIDGARVARLVAKRDFEGLHDVRVEIVDGATSRPHALFDACREADVALRGDVIAVTCDGEASTLVRSDDGGKTYHDVPTAVRGRTRSSAALAVGDGFIYYGPRCGHDCSPARTVDAQNHWRDVPNASDPIAFARDGAELWDLGTDLVVHRWRGPTPEKVGAAPPQTELRQATFGVANGRARVAVHTTAWRAWEVGADGAAKPIALPLGVATVAFAGLRGLAVDELGLIETLDGAKWRRVSGPRVREIFACSTVGCVTDRGARLGWSGRGAEVTVTRAKSIACRATGPWTELGGSQLAPDADAVDHGGSRWVAGLRDAKGVVTVARAPWSVTTPLERVAMLDAAASGEKDRSWTRVFVQPAGVVARRFSYTKAGFRERTPVTLEAAWVRDDGQRFEVKRTLGAFTVPQHDPQDPQGSIDDTVLDGANVATWLGAKGLWQNVPASGLWHFMDDGAAQTYFAGAYDRVIAPAIVLEGEEPSLAGIAYGPVTLAAPRTDDAVQTNPLLDELGEVQPFAGRLALLMDRRALSFSISGKGAIGDVSELVRPKQDGACPAAPGPGAITLPWVAGERRVVTVAADGEDARVLVTARVRARVAGKDACTVAWEAVLPTSLAPRPKIEDSALVFAGDLEHSVELRRDHGVWPSTLSSRPLSCAYAADAPLPEELSNTSGFVVP